MLCKSHCNVFGPGDHATTFGGNPLACAAGLQVAKAIDEGECHSGPERVCPYDNCPITAQIVSNNRPIPAQ